MEYPILNEGHKLDLSEAVSAQIVASMGRALKSSKTGFTGSERETMKSELKAAICGTDTGSEELFTALARLSDKELETLLFEVFQK